MMRPALLFALAVQAATVCLTPAAAQQAGGEALDPEVLSTPGAAELIRERAFVRLQTLNALRTGLVGAVAPNANTVNPALDRSAINQQALARIPARPERNRAPAGGTVAAPTVIDQSLVVNAFGSPVSIGNGNHVQQQVANSTALSVGAPASATAATTAEAGERRPGAGAGQSATSLATSSAPPAGPGRAAPR